MAGGIAGATAGAAGAQPTGNSQSFTIQPPTISLPKGGGAIRGMGEKFAANPVTGTGSMTVPIAASPGRGGFGPQLSLSYDSGAGNGPFGLGWSLGIPAIRRKTDRGLPQYLDAAESDTFLLAGAEDLVPLLSASGELPAEETVRVYSRNYRIRRYRPRIEGLFARIERWTAADDPAQMFWRTISRDNITSWYGRSDASRVRDPEDPARSFEWFLCETYDDKGNAAVYRYSPENGAGVDRRALPEANRPAHSRESTSYLTSIVYGNRTPFLPSLTAAGRAWEEPPSDANAWMFELRFDYGDIANLTTEQPDSIHPELGPRGRWSVRTDPFSSHRAGFEVRTRRLCRRVLMLHHFPDQPEVGPHCLVKSTDFRYEQPSAAALADPEQPSYTVLRAVVQRSYQRRPATSPGASAPPGYAWRALPSLTFTYSQPRVDTTLRRIAAADLPNLPVGTQGAGYQWVDLDGEGLSGVLSEQGGAWHYAANRGDGRFGPSRVVAPVPAIAALAGGRQQLMDLAGDGAIELVEFGGPTPGFHERTSEGGWTRHVPFRSLPSIDWQDPNLRFVDLTGDGHADALISEQEVFTWYPSLEERGFASALRQRQAADEESGPRLVFNDGSQTIFLADMSGDGLTDLVRIRNGSVCYWPNLGYGMFGQKVSLANAPRFDAPDQFDPARLRLADIDGSGPTDLIYLGRGGAQLYLNRSGNSFSNGRLVPLPLATANLAAVQVADLLGIGTACLVWNSHLPADASHPVRYIDLMADGKPHLLTRVVNNLGGSTEIDYTPSTRFYLDDLAAGTPWVSRLPFPVHCVSKVTVYDAWRNTTFSSTYSYHHGYFDGPEREFRGFGRVEQIDLDAYGSDANIASPWVTDDRRLFQPPIKTVTWYHVGAAIDRQRIAGHFLAEYFPRRYAGRLPTGAGAFREKPLPEPELPADLSAQEWQEALRACKGMVLRQEIYELDLDDLVGPGRRQREVRLYSVASHNCQIQRLQPKGANQHAVFLVTESEAITYHHELPIPSGSVLLSPDPRIAHTLNLRRDAYGNLEQAVAIGYPRWTAGGYPGLPDPARIAAVQNELHMAYTEVRTTGDALLAARDNDLLSPLRHHRLRLPCETRTYVITDLARPAGFYFDIDTLRRHRLSEDQQRFPAAGPQAGQQPVANLLYHEQPTAGTPHRRIVEHRRTLFFNDGADNAPPTLPLPFGQLGPRGLKYEDYGLALSDALLNAVFGDMLDWRAEASTPGTPGRTCRQLLIEPERSGYVPGDYKVPGNSQGLGDQSDHYWMRSGVAGFAPDAHQHFYLPERYTDPFGNTTTLRFDPLDLYVAESKDARDNTTAVARFDYRVLAPIELVDANSNHTEVAHDLLGMVVAMAVKGKEVQGNWQADHLDGFGFALRNPDPAQVTAFCSNRVFDAPQEQQARAWLGTATTRFVYHFGGPYGADGQPLPSARMASACAIAREIHWGQPGGPNAPLQITLECSDGSGAVLMQKVQAEPDAATPNQRRWLVNGLTLLNNKGKPVKQFEPAFSVSFGCEMPQANGVSTTIIYDAAGRVVRTEMPDGSFSRVEFSPWDSASWDANDTVKGSRWYRERLRTAERGAGAPAGSAAEEQNATQASPEAKRAARLAAQHGETPAQVLLDSLGREVISVAHNRTPDANGVWQSEKHVTFTKLDAEGKPLWIRDALGHLVMQYITPPRANNAAGEAMPRGAAPCYDMAGNLLFQHSMDAGPRWSLNDAAGKPLFGWDVYRAVDTAAATPQKRLYVSDYDALHRPTQQWLVVDADAPRLIEAFDYCDTKAPRDAAGGLSLVAVKDRNLIGQAVRHFDPSGLATLERLDLSGQPTHLTRRLVKVIEAQDNEPALNWNVANRETLLEEAADETFRQFSEHDALGRMVRLVNWHRPQTNRVAVYVPRYNARGLLEGEKLHLRASIQVGTNDALAIDPSPVASHNHEAIRAIRYNAKGQKERLELGNGTLTTYSYDPDTFRLSNLHTQRTIAPRGLQVLAYTYDPVGNITTLIDRAQETVYQNNTRIEPKHAYVYDALYRLVQATGRENAAAQGPPPADEGPWPKGSFPSATSVRGYTQSYRYDAVGNFQTMQHVPTQGTGWTRHYAYAFEDSGQPASNRLWRTWKNGLVWDGTGADSVTYRYDSHGSMLNLNRVEVPPAQAEDWGHQIVWDWRDMMRGFDAIGGGMARYYYGIDKQRTRKHITRIGGGEVKDRLYLGGFELYRRRNASGTVVEEIETHHLFEGDQRVLLVDDVITTNRRHANGVAYRTQPILRYQYGNHLGSVALELDEAAQIISYEEFQPYGTSAFRLMRSDTEAPTRRYRYTGMEKDEESGLCAHGARSYAPHLGRWCSVDPLGVTVGPNAYRYADLSPGNAVDKSGLQPLFSDRTESGEVLPAGVRAVPVPLRPPRSLPEPEIPSQFRLPLILPILPIDIPDQRPSFRAAKVPLDPGVGSLAYQNSLAEWARLEARTPLEKLAGALEQHAEKDFVRWLSQLAPLANALQSRQEAGQPSAHLAPTHAKTPAGPWKQAAPSLVGDTAAPVSAPQPRPRPRPRPQSLPTLQVGRDENSPIPVAAPPRLSDTQLLSRVEQLHEQLVVGSLAARGRTTNPQVVARYRAFFTVGVMQANADGRRVVLVGVNSPAMERYLQPLLRPGEVLVPATVIRGLNENTGNFTLRLGMNLHVEQSLAVAAYSLGASSGEVATSNPACSGVCAPAFRELYREFRHINPSLR